VVQGWGMCRPAEAWLPMATAPTLWQMLDT